MITPETRVKITAPHSAFDGEYGTVAAVDHPGSVRVLLDCCPVPLAFAVTDLEPHALTVVRKYGTGPGWKR